MAENSGSEIELIHTGPAEYWYCACRISCWHDSDDYTQKLNQPSVEQCPGCGMVAPFIVKKKLPTFPLHVLDFNGDLVGTANTFEELTELITPRFEAGEREWVLFTYSLEERAEALMREYKELNAHSERTHRQAAEVWRLA